MSIEEQVEEYYKKQLDRYGLRHYGKTEPANDAIARALKNANSKSGGSGNNYPDIQLLLVNANRRSIPVMIEAKGTKNKLERLNTDHQIDMSQSSYIQGYAVNGALHYGNAILDEGTYSEVIIVGINGTEVDPVTGIVKDPELKAYYVAKKNSGMPKYIPDFDFVRCMPSNLGALFDELDTMSLSDAEREQIKRQTEQTLEERVKAIHQSIYDDPKLRVMLDTNGKLYLFCGLIMAGMPIAGAADLSPKDLTSNTTSKINDGTLIMDRIELFLESRESTQDKVNMVRNLFQPTFSTEGLWRPDDGGISILHTLYKQIKEEIIPLFKEGINLDFTGKILNSLSDWASISDDAKNDVVLTPRYVTKMMAIMARTNMDSLVWDSAMGSAGFLVSAMDLMIRDAEIHIHDKAELKKKIKNIKQHQLLGVEILGPVFVLAVLNMILMGDGSSQIVRGDSHTKIREGLVNNFPATVYLLNPPQQE